ncbi:MAG: 50S ribosomal protein L20 [Candidatus Bostrichicola ureolyticus]|nr:MAG: 50S ribosomal protein L20 [Candidatus Bostrichicola ureolyticus]
MPRSVNSVAAKRKRKNILKYAKGYYGVGSKVYTIAKNRVEKAFQHAYIGRKQKKIRFRALWIQRINAVVRTFGISYSKFIDLLYNNNINLNRKVIADLAINNPNILKYIIIEYLNK